MTKADIVNQVAQSTGMNASNAAVAVNALLRTVAEALVEGHRIELRGFGVFETVIRAPRTGWNPWKGPKVQIPSRRAPVFRPGKRLKLLDPTDNTRHSRTE